MTAPYVTLIHQALGLPYIICIRGSISRRILNLNRKPILVTGATGFIGAHIVDNLLSRGMKVRGTTRSLAKGEAMIEARPKYKSQLEFVQIADFERSADFTKAVEGVGAIIHTASVRARYELSASHLGF